MREAHLRLATWACGALLAIVLLLWWASYWPALSRHAHQAIDAGAQLRHGYVNWGASRGRISVVRIRDCDDGLYNVSPAGRVPGVSWDSGTIRPRRKPKGYYRIELLEVSYAWLALPLVATNLIVWCRRRLARHASGMCTTCGYDLRATPQRCPECGAVPAVK